jgi:hypothetical protein
LLFDLTVGALLEPFSQGLLLQQVRRFVLTLFFEGQVLKFIASLTLRKPNFSISFIACVSAV